MVFETKRGKRRKESKGRNQYQTQPTYCVDRRQVLSLGNTDGRGPTGGVCSFLALQLADAMIRLIIPYRCKNT